MNLANSDRHRSDAKKAGFITGLVTLAVTGYYVSLPIGILLAPLVSVLTYTGGMFPDIDHTSSEPYRTLRKLVTIGVVLAVGFLTFIFWRDITGLLNDFIDDTIFVWSLVLAGSVLVIYWGRSFIMKGVNVLTGSHRGRTHKPFILLVLCVLFAGGLWMYLPEIEVFGVGLNLFLVFLVPAGFYIGTMTHIFRDIFS